MAIPMFGSGSSSVAAASIHLVDDSTNDVSTTKHGFVPKAPNDATKFLDGTGVFSTPSASLSNPMTTPADLIVGGTAGAPARLAKGSDSQILTIDPSTHLIVWANATSGFSNPMTTRGDVIIENSSPAPARLAIGSAGKVLHSDGTDPSWQTIVEGDLGTTDITTANVTSTKHGFAPKSPADATQFLNGAATAAFAAVKDSDLSTTDITTNNVTTSKHGFAPKAPNVATQYLDGTGTYSTPAGFANPMTTQDDIIIGGASGVPARLAKGSDSQVLTVDPSTHHLVWATASSGFSNPMTTRGDIIIENSSPAPARLAVGSANTVLKSNGTDPSWGAVLPADIDITTDNTTSNSTTGHHGFLPKLGGGTTNFLRADGSWSAPSGGSGATIQYPALKPSPPTYEFDGASLDGAFSAHSSGGSFTTANALTQGIDWLGSSVELQYSQQFGGIYVAHSDTDLDFTVGGIRCHYMSEDAGTNYMFGIAALDSAGTGVGVMAYSADSTAYVAEFTTWNYATYNYAWASKIMGTLGADSPDLWMRIKRISGTWTGYISKSGRAWDFTFSTSSESITVDRLYFGLLFDNTKLYNGRLTADYFHVAA